MSSLYREQELVTADSSRVVFICQSKADADALASLDCLATYAPSWSNGVAGVTWGRKLVAIAPDDARGRDFAASTYTSLARNAGSYRHLLVGSVPDGRSLAEWVALVTELGKKEARETLAKMVSPLFATEQTPIELPPEPEQPAQPVVEGNVVRLIQPDKKRTEPAPATEWAALLLRNKDGAVKGCLANAIIALQHDLQWRGAIGFDTFAYQTKALLPGPIDAEPGAWRPIDDTRTTNWLQHQGIGVGTLIAQEAVEAVAHGNPFNPLREYLDALEWDGRPRLSHWLTTYCGAKDSLYVRAAGRAWAISAIARAFDPGCQVDMALILEGDQGTGKSTTFRVLGGDWFTDDMHEMGSKDSAMQAAGVWLVEISELASMGKADIDVVKAFLPRRIDRFRPPYGRRVIEKPRGCVFCGTINPGGAGYLRDVTGGRRFLPIESGVIDIEALKRDRDQLWAEARHAYRIGEAWYLRDDDVKLAAQEEQEARRETDSWEGRINEWVESGARTSVTVAQVLADCLFIEAKDQDMSRQKRAGQVLRALGFRSKSVREGDVVKRAWMKERPM